MPRAHVHRYAHTRTRTLMDPVKQPSASGLPGVGASARGSLSQCTRSALATWPQHVPQYHCRVGAARTLLQCTWTGRRACVLSATGAAGVRGSLPPPPLATSDGAAAWGEGQFGPRCWWCEGWGWGGGSQSRGADVFKGLRGAACPGCCLGWPCGPHRERFTASALLLRTVLSYCSKCCASSTHGYISPQQGGRGGGAPHLASAPAFLVETARHVGTWVSSKVTNTKNYDCTSSEARVRGVQRGGVGGRQGGGRGRMMAWLGVRGIWDWGHASCCRRGTGTHRHRREGGPRAIASAVLTQHLPLLTPACARSSRAPRCGQAAAAAALQRRAPCMRGQCGPPVPQRTHRW